MGMAVVAIGGFAQTHRFCEPRLNGVATWAGNASTRLSSASFPRLRLRYGAASCEPLAERCRVTVGSRQQPTGHSWLDLRW